jgi:hypothetical protein
MRLKSTSKEKQKEFIDGLRELFEDPASLIPECVDGGMFCSFNSYRKKVEPLAASQAYDKFTKTADQFLSGLSETHRIMESDSAPIFGMLKTPYGSIEYAKRGTTDDAVLVGIQHYKSPLWRMFAFSSLAKTKGARVYSSTNFFLASCKNSSPGREFFEDCLKDEGIQFQIEDDAIVLPGSGKYMEVLHLGDVKFKFYENSTTNLLHSLMKHILTPDIGKDFSFRSDYLSDLVGDIPAQSLTLYFSGKINDRTFLREVNDYRTSEAVKKGYFIVGENGYTSIDDFISENEFKYVPENIMKEALENYAKGIYMEAFSERKVLEIIWSSSGSLIMKGLFPELSDSEIKSLKGSPTDQIDSVAERSRIEEIKSDIEVKAWSQDSQYLIDIIKDYFTLGRERALREAEKTSGKSHVRKAIFYTFLDCLGEAKNREWQFNDTERDLSWKIKPYICRILENGTSVMAQEIENIKVFIR